MKQSYEAVVAKDGKWWIGWVEDVQGVNSQGRTKKELLENLRSALKEALQMNRKASRASLPSDYQKVIIEV